MRLLLNRMSPKWFDVFIGVLAAALAFLIYWWLHDRWWPPDMYRDGWSYARWQDGWGAWAAESVRFDIGLLCELFFGGCYVITGIVAGGFASVGSLNRQSRMIRFCCGPGLMGLFWIVKPIDIDNPILPLFLYCGVVVVAFLVGASGWKLALQKSHDLLPVAWAVVVLTCHKGPLSAIYSRW